MAADARHRIPRFVVEMIGRRFVACRLAGERPVTQEGGGMAIAREIPRLVLSARNGPATRRMPAVFAHGEVVDPRAGIDAIVLPLEEMVEPRKRELVHRAVGGGSDGGKPRRRHAVAVEGRPRPAPCDVLPRADDDALVSPRGVAGGALR